MRDAGLDREELCRYLSERDVACPGCGYNLRGLRGDRCPECNRLLRLTVAAVDAGIGPLISAALGLGSSGAAAVALLAVVVLISMDEGNWPDDEDAVLLLLVPSVVAAASGACVALLATGRRRSWFLRLRPAAQWWLAAACWIVSITAAVVWMKIVTEVV